MEKYKTLSDLAARWNDAVAYDGKEPLRVKDAAALRSARMDELAFNSVFAPDDEVKKGARALISAAAVATGAKPASIHDLYAARGRGELHGFTVPAVNVRCMTYDFARAMFRVAQKNDCAAMVFEIARSEIGYTFQRPGEYAPCVLAAALREGWKWPVFIQGDHFQVNAKKYADPKTREHELQAIRDLIGEAIAAGFWNIDIDTSTLVDLSKPTLDEQQRTNYELCAHYTKLIREKEPKGVTISVGGEIGEVGTVNSTVEELTAYVDGYHRTLGKLEGISKVSVQSGTSHGGIPLPGGGVAQVKLDFKTLEDLSKVARERYHMAGAVQHGASTLPTELFHHFPKVETAEIHLATEFQNMILDHKAFPAELRDEMHAWCAEHCKDERKDGQTETQFFYKTRKKAWGPFKERVWTLAEKDVILKDLEARFDFLWKQLAVGGTRAAVEKYVKPPDFKPVVPAGLKVG
ncbi:MAG TPA: class II fructose-bisphosphate aldolase [Myxococcales bacterium]|nr:class II fructose-bisphosphate aldolase [Myxococcales bacterium]